MQIRQEILLIENLHRDISHLHVGGNLVTWRSKKQKIVTLSSVEAEFRGMTKGLCELLWLKRLLKKIGYTSQDTMNLFCDNKAAIATAQNPIQHYCTKHVEID